MKKILLILISIILTQTIDAQTTLDEGFESWPLANWEIYFLGDAIDGWREDFEAISHTGSHSAYSSISNAFSDNWMVTPPVTISNANYELKFWELNSSIDEYNKVSVQVSSGNGNPNIQKGTQKKNYVE